jgi:hypothetical protein
MILFEFCPGELDDRQLFASGFAAACLLGRAPAGYHSRIV